MTRADRERLRGFYERVRRHTGRVFIPGWRMRKIKWEEAVVASHMRRNGLKPEVTHFNCSCGSLNCLGNAISYRHITKEEADALRTRRLPLALHGVR